MHEDCAKEQFDKDNGTCDVCGESLGNGEPIIELSDYSKFHQSCFKCTVCGKPFDKKNPYHVKVNGKPCHTKCADVADDVTEQVIKNNKGCTKCGKPIDGAVKVVPDVGNFHPECFVCDTCGCELSGSFSLHPKTELPNCKKCVTKFVQKWDRNKEERDDKKSGKACMKCGKPIKSGAKKVPGIGSFHPECFVCDTCGCELKKKYFTHPKTKMPNCKPCLDKFVEKANSKETCVKCGKIIKSGGLNVPNVGIMHSDCFVCGTCGDVLTGLMHRGKYAIHPKTKVPNCKPCVNKFVKKSGGAVVEEEETEKKTKSEPATCVNENDCVKCGKAVDPDDAKVIPDVGSYHPECFSCDTCGCSINRKYKIHPKSGMPNCRPCMEKYENQ